MAHLFTGYDPQPQRGALAGTKPQHHEAAHPAAALVVRFSEQSALAKSLTAGQPMVPALSPWPGVRASGLRLHRARPFSRVRLNRHLLAPFLTAPTEHLAPVAGRHARPKAVFALPLLPRRMVRRFHCLPFSLKKRTHTLSAFVGGSSTSGPGGPDCGWQMADCGFRAENKTLPVCCTATGYSSSAIGHRLSAQKGPAVPILVLMVASAIERPSWSTGARRARQIRRRARQTKW